MLLQSLSKGLRSLEEYIEKRLFRRVGEAAMAMGRPGGSGIVVPAGS